MMTFAGSVYILFYNVCKRRFDDQTGCVLPGMRYTLTNVRQAEDAGQIGRMCLMLETKRLLLRRWEESDAEALYEYAKDPDVGPSAGWPAHQSVGESLDVIRNVLNAAEAYAICLKEGQDAGAPDTALKAIGAIELKLNGHTYLTERDDECELGFWLGKPFWGRGIMSEAAKEMLRHAFEDLGMQKVWCAYYDGNTKSKRTQEKCGFRYQWTAQNVDVPLMHEKRTGHVNLITKDVWLGEKLYEAPLSVQDNRKTPGHDETGGVSDAKKGIG